MNSFSPFFSIYFIQQRFSNNISTIVEILIAYILVQFSVKIRSIVQFPPKLGDLLSVKTMEISYSFLTYAFLMHMLYGLARSPVFPSNQYHLITFTCGKGWEGVNALKGTFYSFPHSIFNISIHFLTYLMNWKYDLH